MADNLVASGIELDTRDLLRAIDQASRRLDRLEDEFDGIGRAAKKQESAFDGLGRKVVQLAAAYGAFRSAQSATRFIFDTNVEFQALEARLVSITGSVEGARSAFALITDFAKTTPYEVQNLTQAFTTLNAAGITPTADMMRDLGNFASAMGRDITDLVEAILRASQGGTERLRESFFIPIQKEGDNLRISFRGNARTVSADAQSLIGYFQELSQQNFGDAMERQMGTMDGAISNLKDSASLLAKDIGEAGLNGEVSNLVRRLDQAIQESENFAEVLGGALASGVAVSTEALELFVKHIDLVVIGLQVVTGAAVGAGLAALTGKLTKAAAAAGGLAAAMRAMSSGTAVGLVLTLAGAVGGPLVANLLSARREAGGFGDEMERLNRLVQEGNKKALTSELLNLRRQEVAAGANLANLQMGIAPNPAGLITDDMMRSAESRLFAIRQRIAQVNAALFAPTSPSKPTGGGGGSNKEAEKIAQRAADMVAAYDRQRIAIEQGERAALAFELSLSDLNAEQQKAVLAAYDYASAAETRQKAEEQARREAEERRRAVDSLIESLERERLEMEGGERALALYTLEQNGATDADRQRVEELLKVNRALREGREAEEEMRRDREAAREAEAQMFKSTADRMAEDFMEFVDQTVSGTESVSDAFAQMVADILAEWARMQVRMNVMEPLSAWLSTAIGAAAGAAGAGSATAGPNSPIAIDKPMGMSRAAPGATQFTQVLHFNVSAIDARGVAQFVEENRGAIAAATAQAARESDGFRRALVTGGR